MRYWSYLVASLRRWLGALTSAHVPVASHEHDDNGPPAEWLADLARYGLSDQHAFQGGTIGGDITYVPSGQIPDAPNTKRANHPAPYADPRISPVPKGTPSSSQRLNGRVPPRQIDPSPLRVISTSERNAPENPPKKRIPIRPRVVTLTHTASVNAPPPVSSVRQPVINQPEPAAQARLIDPKSFDTNAAKQPDAYGQPVQNTKSKPAAKATHHSEPLRKHTYTTAPTNRPHDQLAGFDAPQSRHPTNPGSTRGTSTPALQRVVAAVTAPPPLDAQRPEFPRADVTPQPPNAGHPSQAVGPAELTQSSRVTEARESTAPHAHETEIRFPAVPIALAQNGRLEVGEDLRRRLDAAARSLVWGS